MIRLSLPKALIAFVGFVAASNASAQCKNPQLTDFAAYAIESMDVRSSDYQGLAGAGTAIKSENFLFEGNPATCLAVTTPGWFELSSGRALQAVEAGEVYLNHARVSGAVVSLGQARLSSSTIAGALRSPVRPQLNNSSRSSYHTQANFRTQHATVAHQLYDASARMAALPASANLEGVQGALVVHGAGQTVVANLQAAAFNSSARLIVLRGNPGQNFVVNVWGSEAILSGVRVILEGGVTPAQISWNFPQAGYLFIANTADGVIGLPGAVYAPHAITEFYDALITGALYVRLITFDPARGFRNSGQINRSQIALPPGTRPFN